MRLKCRSVASCFIAPPENSLPLCSSKIKTFPGGTTVYAMAQERSHTLWFNRPVVDPHIVDQAGPIGTRGQRAADTEVQTSGRGHEARLGISRHLYAIN